MNKLLMKIKQLFYCYKYNYNCIDCRYVECEKFNWKGD